MTSLRLSAITDEISQDFEHALDVMLEYGVQGAELRGLWGTNISDLTPEQAERARAALKQRGLPVVGLATPFFKCDLEEKADASADGPMHLAPPRDFSKQMEILERSIKLAHFFETPFLRVFTFWRRSAPDEDIMKRIANAFEQPLKRAEQEGLTLILENEHACYIGSGAETAQFMPLVSSPALRVCWDPGNAFTLGERPFPDGYELVRPWTSHVHLKDARMVDTPAQGRQAKWCVMGDGEIDYAGQFAALKNEGYSGYVSLETHFVPPTGSGPDGKGTPEDGSRPCLAYLQKALSL